MGLVIHPTAYKTKTVKKQVISVQSAKKLTAQNIAFLQRIGLKVK
jgi:hypothetical protein